MPLLVPDRRLRAAVKHGWTRLVTAARPRHRLPHRQRGGHSSAGAATIVGAVPPPAPALDLVALTVLAVNRLGPATMRTVSIGKPLTVTVPDARIGEIFRAALAETQKTRLTDRLIDIVVDERSPSRA